MRPRVFTDGERCTKADIWAAFTHNGAWRAPSVPLAQSIIGVNVPRVMEREGRLVKKSTPTADVYQLTAKGKMWLVAGILAYVRNHPADAARIQNLELASLGGGAVRVRRTR